MDYKKKLIEVALPLEAINAESAREKSIRHGHPSTLHLWWARRPLAAARAVIWASLVDDPSSHPEQFPTEDEQTAERERLFKILERLVKWENSNNSTVLNAAKAEIMRSTNGNPPPLLDPFAGGGAIPLEAQRLGLEAHASDLNPVAVLINKAMIEIPPKFAGKPPVNPETKTNKLDTDWHGAKGLAEDVRYYGEWMKKKAFERISHLYPKVKDERGQEHTVIAWIWARTVKCPNPACGCQMPLVNSFLLSKKKNNNTYVQPKIDGVKIQYLVNYGGSAPEGSIINRRGARCVCCDNTVDFAYIREEANNMRMGQHLIAIVAEEKNGRLYLSPDEEHVKIADIKCPDNVPESELPHKALGINIRAYGFNQHKDLFTNRQLTALTTFSNCVKKAQEKIELDGGSKEYAQAVCVYLAFLVDKIADRGSTVCSWDVTRDGIRNTFGRQAIPIIWDYAEGNAFSNSSGCFDNALDWVVKVVEQLPAGKEGRVVQNDAQNDIGLRNIMVSTDPPYYDNIGYADLSDFFYVWLRPSLKQAYPDLFHTMLVPKTEELIANPFKFDGSKEKAKDFFEEGMVKAFEQVNNYVREDIPLTIYYAFKQSDDDDDKTASTGWETMLSAIIQSGFSITGTWPMRTELGNRMRSVDSNALATSVVLVCRKRQVDVSVCTRRDFINVLKRELKPALQKLQASNIAPVDLAQSAIGPGIGVYSRYSKVLEADGTPMSVRSALQIINQELDLHFTEQDGELDRDSRFCVELYTQYAFNDMKFSEADVLARAKNTSVDKLAARKILHSQKGVVRLLTRDEIPETNEHNERIVWLLAQQLTRAMEKEGVTGVAKIVSDILTSEPEQAKALAYRLFIIAERKGWTQDAYAYNSLIIGWPEVQSKVAELRPTKSNSKQRTLLDM